MKSVLFAVLAAVQSITLAAPTANTRYIKHEKRDESSRWIKRDSVASTFTLPMRFGLAQSRLDEGHDLLMDISDPRSPRYGQHYSIEEVTDIFAPSEDTVAAVRLWLESAGIAPHRISQSTNKQWIQLDAYAHEAEHLLQTKFHIYEHNANGKMSIGCDEYHIPEYTKSHIDYITPGLQMLEFRPEVSDQLRRREVLKGVVGPIVTPYPNDLDAITAHSTLEYCNRIITPNCIFAMYNITAGTSATPGNELGIFEQDTQWIDHEDMNLFFSQLYPKIPNGTFPIIKAIDGAKNVNQPSQAGTESILDVQISYPIIWPQNSIFFLTDDKAVAGTTPGLFNTFLDAIDGSYCTYSAFGETGNNNTVDPVYPNKGYNHPLQCGVYKPTNVISFSYELAEFNEGTTANYQKRQCNEYMKLGLQGVSVVFSSGDAGVSSNWGCGGTTDAPIFNPLFPSNCPYVTSVGATTLTGSAASDHERAVTQFPSGGGFSNYFARPSYQDTAVEGYFNSPKAPKYPYYIGPNVGNGVYNRSGRGYPDIAAIGQAIVNFGNEIPYLVGGTSAATPVFAAMLTRINEERLKAGKTTVGFVNPTLYQNPQAFHDITVGSNPGCGTNGFSCAPGWDPVTGLGTPNYPDLLEVFLAAA